MNRLVWGYNTADGSSVSLALIHPNFLCVCCSKPCYRDGRVLHYLVLLAYIYRQEIV